MMQGSRESESSSWDLWEPRDHRLLLEIGMRVAGGSTGMVVSVATAAASETKEVVEELLVRRLVIKLEREKE